MFNLKRVLLNGLLFAAFAVTPFTVSQLAAQPQVSENASLENSQEISWGGHRWGGRPYYWRHYYRPYYYYGYPYYYPYRPYNYYYW